MPNIDITKPELIWPGKYDEQGNRVINRGVALPFQVVETIQEGRATREPGRVSDLFSAQPSGNDEWRNKLIWGDNLLVMASLLEEYAGKVDLVYIDPPFHAGADFSFKVQVGGETIEKEASLIEEKAYRDTWGQGLQSYLDMLAARLAFARELLAPTGSLYVHLDHNVSHYAKVLLDEIMGRENYRNEIVWQRTSARSDSKTYNHIHDTIFLYTRTDTWKWTKQHTEYDPQYIENFYRYQDPDGRRFTTSDLTAAGTRKGSSGMPWRGIDPTAKGRHWAVPALAKQILPNPNEKDTIKVLEELDAQGRIYWPEKEGGMPRFKRYLDEMPGTALQSIWTDISPVAAHAQERTGYDTQKPEPLLERIITASSRENDLVMDFFCGSGTTCAVAEKLNRRWIGCDLGRFAIHTTRKRLLEIPDCKPFEILNLGQYERKYWQGVTFGGEKPATPDQAAVAAYVQFILELYHAQPLPGTHIHGRKGGALVHVGAVDAPVTISEINAALTEAAELGQKELHILGWEWEMGLHDPLVQQAKQSHGLRLRLLNIPREVMERQAVERNDVRFFDLAHLEAELVPVKGSTRKVKVRLTDFVIPDTDLIPEEVRGKIRKWSDYIDYWAVDFDFQHDTFMNQWQAYRTRKRRLLDLESAEHEYAQPGKYQVLVKVVDIFGNDTSRLLNWEAK